MAYLDNPSGIGNWAVSTSGGRVVAVIVQIIAIALYAAFTGLLVALITAWYKAVVRKVQLENFHIMLLSAFHRQYVRPLSQKQGYSCYVVPSQKLLATLQINANMDLRDVVEVTERYYGFRVKNLANIRSIEDNGVSDRFIVEHFPVNRPYGCRLDRGSNITIVSPTSDSGVGIGWFAYYLALFGGFNYISKDYDPDPLHRTSYYNFEPDVSDAVRQQRDEFQRDLEEIGQKGNNWVIFLLSFAKSKTKPGDIHLSCTREDGGNATVKIADTYKYCAVERALMSELAKLEVQGQSDLFPLKPNNIIYVSDGLREKMNAFTMRISSGILKTDTDRLSVAADIARILRKHLSSAPCNGIPAETKADLQDKKTESYPLKDWE